MILRMTFKEELSLERFSSLAREDGQIAARAAKKLVWAVAKRMEWAARTKIKGHENKNDAPLDRK